MKPRLVAVTLVTLVLVSLILVAVEYPAVRATPVSGAAQRSTATAQRGAAEPFLDRSVYLPSVRRNFVPACPDVPILLSPADQSTVATLIPEFRWQTGPAAHATSGWLTISPSPAFDTDSQLHTFQVTSGEGAYRFTTNLKPGTTYYWRIRYICDDVWGAASAAFSFTTTVDGPLLPAPQLLAPADGTTLPPTRATLRWAPVSGATGYLLTWGEIPQQSCSDQAITGVVHERWLTDTTYEFSQLSADTTYRWWVSAHDDYALGDASEIWDFTTSSSSVSGEPGR